MKSNPSLVKEKKWLLPRGGVFQNINKAIINIKSLLIHTTTYLRPLVLNERIV